MQLLISESMPCLEEPAVMEEKALHGGVDTWRSECTGSHSAGSAAWASQSSPRNARLASSRAVPKLARSSRLPTSLKPARVAPQLKPPANPLTSVNVYVTSSLHTH